MFIKVLIVCVFIILIGLWIGHSMERRAWKARREYLQRRYASIERHGHANPMGAGICSLSLS